MDSQQRRASKFNYRPSSSVDFKRFSSEYYSGTDIRIYFGDIWIDEITSLQWTLQENVANIYGYASYTWDRIARGTRFVQGSFSINFKESGYLNTVLNHLGSQLEDNSTSSGISQSQWKEGANIEHLMSKTGDDLAFERMADEFENSLWGQGSMKNFQKSKNTTSFFYGNNQSQGELEQAGFNIVVGYGPMTETGGERTAITAHTLIGVHLTSVSQAIGEDGEVQEVYGFIAKDMDGDVTVRSDKKYVVSNTTASSSGGKSTTTSNSPISSTPYSVYRVHN